MQTLAVVLVLVLPIDKASANYYHLSSLAYRGSTLLTYLPVFIVWAVAFWGYAQIQQYAKALEGASERPYYMRLAYGVAWLAWSLPISFIASHVLDAIGLSHPSLHNASVIIANYIYVALSLVAFIVIGAAARKLGGFSGLNVRRKGVWIPMALVLILASSYCFVLLRQLNITSLGSNNNFYHLPIWLIVVTIIIPYLYAWFVGLLAAYEIAVLSHKTDGILYKRALSYVVFGLFAIILSNVSVQYISSVWVSPDHATFNNRFITLVLVRMLSGLGFISLSIGASKLRRIEEV